MSTEDADGALVREQHGFLPDEDGEVINIELDAGEAASFEIVDRPDGGLTLAFRSSRVRIGCIYDCDPANCNCKG